MRENAFESDANLSHMVGACLAEAHSVAKPAASKDRPTFSMLNRIKITLERVPTESPVDCVAEGVGIDGP